MSNSRPYKNHRYLFAGQNICNSFVTMAIWVMVYINKERNLKIEWLRMNLSISVMPSERI